MFTVAATYSRDACVTVYVIHRTEKGGGCTFSLAKESHIFGEIRPCTNNIVYARFYMCKFLELFCALL